MRIERELRKPACWQDFERLCCQIYKAIWNDPNAKMHGRSGQAQQGVDIYGHDNGDCDYSGVQCKRYDKISESIIDDEIKEAETFDPPLKQLIIATTAPRDTKIEKIVRQKDVAHRQKGLFGISILEWEDIVEILEQNPPLLNWYENSVGTGSANSIKVSFPNGSEETIIRPRFKEKVYYPKDAYAAKGNNPLLNTGCFHPFAKPIFATGSINRSFVPIEIQIANIGMIAIRPVSLILTLPDNVAIASTNEHHNIPLLSVTPGHTYIDDNTRTVYYRSEGLLPNRRGMLSKIYVKPDPSIQEFEIEWDFSSESFTKQGTLKVKVEADISHDYISSSKNPLPENKIEDFIENISSNRRSR